MWNDQIRNNEHAHINCHYTFVLRQIQVIKLYYANFYREQNYNCILNFHNHTILFLYDFYLEE